MISKNQIKYIQSLQHKKQREISKRFVAEGVKTCTEILLQAPELIEELICIEDFFALNKKTIQSSKTKTTVVSDTDLKRISGLNTANEVICICKQLSDTETQTNFQTSFSFYLDGIRDPGNLGTIIRICNWFGIHELFCSEDTVELYNPKCIQACMGAFLRVKVFYCPLSDLINQKEISNVCIADLEGESIYESPVKTGLIIIGNEANGVSREAKNIKHKAITIPSANSGMESLNAAVATSIIASEYFRKRL